MSAIIQKSFSILYPSRTFRYESKLTYSGRFSDYNANLKLQNSVLHMSLSRKWRGVNQDIVIGLIQSLMVKMFGRQKPTVQMDLYSLFIKNLHIAAPKENVEPHLRAAFRTLNAHFFDSQIEQPNLRWGQYSTRKLGSYDFQTDTITISTVFQHTEPALLQYVLYHEMLHKHLKFSAGPCKNSYHSKEFRRAEKLFPNAIELERKLRFLPKKPKKPSIFTNMLRMFSFP